MTGKTSVLTVLMVCVASHSALGQVPAPDEVAIGPIITTQLIQGVSVTIPVTAFLKLTTKDNAIGVDVRVVGNLGDLQQKIGSIIDTLPLPTNVCNHFGVDNIVARIWGKQLNAEGDSLVLKLNGDVDDWTCVKNPVPCTRVDWAGGFIKYPQVTVYDCNSPIENKNINQPFDASVAGRVQLVDPQTVTIVLANPSITLGGKLGGLTQGVLRVAGVDINQKASDALRQAVDPSKLKQALPPDLQSLNLAISSAGFSSLNGQALVTLTLGGKVPANQLSTLLQAMLQQHPSANSK